MAAPRQGLPVRLERAALRAYCARSLLPPDSSYMKPLLSLSARRLGITSSIDNRRSTACPSRQERGRDRCARQCTSSTAATLRRQDRHLLVEPLGVPARAGFGAVPSANTVSWPPSDV